MPSIYHLLKDRLSYNPDTGVLTWKEKEISHKNDFAWNSRLKGAQAGSIHKSGYLMVGLRGIARTTRYAAAHRLAWLIYYGELPKNIIDHIDGNKTNNRISNLRDATYKENAKNRWLDDRNNSGVHGVFWDKDKNKWRLQACVDGKKIHGGYFDSIDRASIEAIEFFKKLGFSNRHGQKKIQD